MELDDFDDVVDVPEPDVLEPEEVAVALDDVDAAPDFLAAPSLEPLDESLEPEDRESLR